MSEAIRTYLYFGKPLIGVLLYAAVIWWVWAKPFYIPSVGGDE